MPYREQPIEKLYYSIGEVAELLNVSTSLIRYWEKEFDALKPKKNKKGNRLFKKEDIETLRLIYHLVKEKGFTLDGARKTLKSDRKATEARFVLIERLEQVKNALQELESTL